MRARTLTTAAAAARARARTRTKSRPANESSLKDSANRDHSIHAVRRELATAATHGGAHPLLIGLSQDRDPPGDRARRDLGVEARRHLRGDVTVHRAEPDLAVAGDARQADVDLAVH